MFLAFVMLVIGFCFGLYIGKEFKNIKPDIPEDLECGCGKEER